MRRSICFCEPSFALAGETNTWKFNYTPSTALNKGSHLRFDIVSQGRPIDWQPPTCAKTGANVIFGVLPNGKTVQPKAVEIQDSFVPQYEFVLPSDVPAGETFQIVMGRSGSGDKPGNNQAQTITQRRRPFLLYVDPSGKGRYQDPEVFSMDIRGGELDTIQVLAPSYVIRNKRFDVTVRFEDQYGNLTCNAPEDTLIELSYENIRENLNWKLFVPETGFINLPNLYFNEAGIYTLHLENLATKEVYRSAPIKCFLENDKQLFWGLLHGESEKFDSTENIENCLRHFRDERALNIFATSCFESPEETPTEIWKSICQNIAEINEDERFTAYLGFQWAGEAKEEGVRQFLFSKDNKMLLRKKDNKASSLKKIYKSFTAKELLSIPSFTMGKGSHFDFQNFNPEFERVVEIYNAWGSSECSKKEGNSRPISAPGRSGTKEAVEGGVLKALLANHRFGFVAGGLDDRGIYQDFFDSDQEQYSPGLTAILSKDPTRETVWDAIYNRSCYATTGERIIVGIYLAGAPMGQELSTADKPGLLVNRHISGYVAGTQPITKAEIICNGKVVHTAKSDTYSLNFEFDHLVPFEKVAITPKDKTAPFVFYYLRVTQEDGHMAWSSPIWVDKVPAAKKSGK